MKLFNIFSFLKKKVMTPNSQPFSKETKLTISDLSKDFEDKKLEYNNLLEEKVIDIIYSQGEDGYEKQIIGSEINLFFPSLGERYTIPHIIYKTDREFSYKEEYISIIEDYIYGKGSKIYTYVIQHSLRYLPFGVKGKYFYLSYELLELDKLSEAFYKKMISEVFLKMKEECHKNVEKERHLIIKKIEDIEKKILKLKGIKSLTLDSDMKEVIEISKRIEYIGKKQLMYEKEILELKEKSLLIISNME